MNFEGLMRSFGPHELRKVYLTLREFKLVDEDFLEKFDAAINEGYKQLALENAKTYHEVKKNTEKMKKGEHPTNFVAEGGLVFFKHKTLKCPECGGMVVSSRFCPNGVKESGGYGGVIMCENNELVQANTHGTGGCAYEAWLPETFDEAVNEKKPCKGCKEKK